jgi:hypothetical protein
MPSMLGLALASKDPTVKAAADMKENLRGAQYAARKTSSAGAPVQAGLPQRYPKG